MLGWYSRRLRSLTVAFEFLFFGLAMGMPLSKLLENYNLRTGHLFPIGLILLLFVPWLAASSLRGRIAEKSSTES